ncbi:MAG: choice-of-anchor tandem repeat GloVer-containing protein [Thermosynechococcaceae cyanobacterium]
MLKKIQVRLCGMVQIAALLWPPSILLAQSGDGPTSSGKASTGTDVLRETNGRSFQTLWHFNGRANGAHPKAGLTLAKDGFFYGTTYDGGKYNQGTLFRLSPQGQLAVLIHFNGQNGAYPFGELLQASDDNFYGTTSKGGPRDYGTLFRLTPEGGLTTLTHFYGHRGIAPSGALVEGPDRNLYGTTQKGGNMNRCAGGCVTVFRVDLNGRLLTLLEFNGLNGREPLSGVMVDHDGKLWGTTAKGGQNNVGVVFRLDPNGGFKKMTTFNVTNGARPLGRLIQGQDNNFYFYGVTQTGGDNGQGTVFRLLPSGQLAPLVHFDGLNGANPEAGLIMNREGLLLGTTVNGAPNQPGSVFQLSIQGQFRVLKTLRQTEGANPKGILVEGPDGFLYGTTENGGQSNLGTVFRIKPS